MRYLTTFFVIVSVVYLTGCSGALPAVKPPSIDADAAAAGALAAFDESGDGSISRDEAKQHCRGMHDAWDRYDENGDDQVDQDELAARFSKWSDGDTGLMNLRAEIRFRGKELPGAKVRLTPYEFLGENVLPAEGETDDYGYVFLAIPKDLLPKTQQATHGMQVGLYRVEISHPQAKLAAKYNTESTLSVDLSPSEANSGIRFVLK